MSDDVREHFEIPQEMRSMAEASFEQARKTFEKFLSSAQATVGSLKERGATVRAGVKDVSAKAIAGFARLRPGAVEGQGRERGDAAAQRICASPDAGAGGAGHRNGPDRQPRGDGCGAAEKLRLFNTTPRLPG